MLAHNICNGGRVVSREGARVYGLPVVEAQSGALILDINTSLLDFLQFEFRRLKR